MIRKNDNLCISEKNNEIVILNMKSGKFFGLQDVSYDVWQALEKYQDVGLIIDEIVKNYNVNRNEAKADVEKLIKDLKENGLVVEWWKDLV